MSMTAKATCCGIRASVGKAMMKVKCFLIKDTNTLSEWEGNEECMDITHVTTRLWKALSCVLLRTTKLHVMQYLQVAKDMMSFVNCVNCHCMWKQYSC